MVSNALLAGIASSSFFVTLNVVMNLYMKWLFSEGGGDFAFPWTMLAMQQLEAFAILQPLLAFMSSGSKCGWDIGGQSEERPSSEVLLSILVVTALFCLNVGLNSLSLVRISITLNQTVRAFLPVGVLLLAVLVERRRYPCYSYATTFVLVVGIALTCWGCPDFDLAGFSLAMGSTMIAALGSSLNGRILTSGSFGKVGANEIMQLMMIQSVPAFFFFGTVAILTEGPGLMELYSKHSSSTESFWVHKLLLVSVSSLLALLSNLGRCFLVAATSALMETLAGNAKVALLCVIDNIMFGTSLSYLNYVGILITCAGFSIQVILQYVTPATTDLAKANAKEIELVASTEVETDGGDDTRDALSENLTRPRIISAADTGLTSEHVALHIGRGSSKSKTYDADTCSSPSSASSLTRRRSQTWDSGSGPSRRLWGLDFTEVLTTPAWLSRKAKERASTDWSSPAAGGCGSHRSRGRCETEPANLHASVQKLYP
eukprot:TRINITY_DN72617_c0_g1_i1.p1 TRINITY_DN72617_c0_g1~~TRINITY_DN72617_c0_g1_i1.p1  ORF type:complete len:500 (+),score=29.15 TRINITY_DN72617_c0_g1_i1:38-1501(+)